MFSGRIDGIGVDEGAASATLAAIRAFAKTRPTIYLPAHDPEAAQRLAEGRTRQGSQAYRGCRIVFTT
jgi:hypothetical protein